MKTLLTILLTSLCWALGIYFYGIYDTKEPTTTEQTEQVAPQKAQPAKAKNSTAPKKKVATTPAKPKTPTINYAEEICGYWLPVEGTTSKLDISKYGTVTRYYRISNIDHWYDRRYEYSISGNKLVVDDHYKCTVNIIVENGVKYLEVYGHEDYAGKYRKR